MADGPVRPILIVKSEPNLHLFSRIRKCQDPVRVQALSANASVERVDESIVRRLARPQEGQGDALGVRPQVELATDELGPLIDPDA